MCTVREAVDGVMGTAFGEIREGGVVVMLVVFCMLKVVLASKATGPYGSSWSLMPGFLA